MDFTEVRDRPEMEAFRKEVRAWLEANVPEEMKVPIDPEDGSKERYHFWLEKNKELGAKGWLNPVFPKEYGGGGLTPEHARVLTEEFHAYGAPYSRSNFILSALMVWATEEQKQKFLVPILKGEMTTQLKYTEPHSGSDLASYESTAVRDGDDWIMNGSNAFPGGHEDGKYWYCGPMLTDPQAPRHRNLGFFMIPYPSPGLEFRRMKMVTGDGQCFIFLDNVRVPGDHLIGGDHQGWQVVNTALEPEHGGEGAIWQRSEEIDSMLRYMQEKRRKSLGADPVAQQKAVEAYMENQAVGAINKRTRWMYHSGMEMSWEGPLTFVFDRISGIRQGDRFRDILGMYSLVASKDPRAYDGGRHEVYQRNQVTLPHRAGSLNISKVTLARRIGISRTRERAAPTPMTAGQSQAQH